MDSFFSKASLSIAIAGLLLLTPFSINNFIQGRYMLGLGCMVIICILAINYWLSRQGLYQPLLTFAGLVPAIIFFLLLSYQEQGVVGGLWSYPAVVSFYFIMPRRYALLANSALLISTLPMAWMVLDHALVLRIAATIITVSIFTAISMQLMTQQHERLQKMAVTDPLTGLYNRSLLGPTLENAISQSHRLNIPMTLITLDIDHFKTINDTHGHDAGDRVLASMAEVLNRSLRKSDTVFRIGGEEFVALLYDAIADNGLQVANKIREVIESHPFLPDQNITASIGVATLEQGEDWTAWMKRGDDNLYQAKSAGRNQVIA